jgi:hypothetical protein
MSLVVAYAPSLSEVEVCRKAYLLPSNYSVLSSWEGFWRLPFKAAVQYKDSYLVDSASSHMLVSKIKPCMSKYKQYIP